MPATLFTFIYKKLWKKKKHEYFWIHFSYIELWFGLCHKSSEKHIRNVVGFFIVFVLLKTAHLDWWNLYPGGTGKPPQINTLSLPRANMLWSLRSICVSFIALGWKVILLKRLSSLCFAFWAWIPGAKREGNLLCEKCFKTELSEN